MRFALRKELIDERFTSFYDAGGRLSEVDDPLGNSYKYSYDAYNEMLTVTDARQILFANNHFDTNGRVIEQDLPTGIWHFAYTIDANGNVIQTDVTNPRGKIQRYAAATSWSAAGAVRLGAGTACRRPPPGRRWRECHRGRFRH